MILTFTASFIGAVTHLLIFRKKFPIGEFDTWSNTMFNAFVAFTILTIISDSIWSVEIQSVIYRILALVLGFGFDFLGKKWKYRKNKK